MVYLNIKNVNMRILCGYGAIGPWCQHTVPDHCRQVFSCCFSRLLIGPLDTEWVSQSVSKIGGIKNMALPFGTKAMLKTTTTTTHTIVAIENHLLYFCLLFTITKVSWLLVGLKGPLLGQIGVELNLQAIDAHYRCGSRIRGIGYKVSVFS